MKKKNMVLTTGLIFSASIAVLTPAAFAAPVQCAKVMSISNRVENLSQYTTYLASHYNDTATLANDLMSTSMVPFLKKANKPAYSDEIKIAIGEFLAPTLLIFSNVYASNQGQAIDAKPLPTSVKVKAVVLTWGEAEDAARALANKRGIQTLRAEQSKLAQASFDQYDKDKDVTAYYERSKKITALGDQIVKILKDSHQEAYGEMAQAPALRSNRDADKIGIVHSERTQPGYRQDHVGKAYNRLVELKSKQPEAFDRVVREMNEDPKRYFAAILKKYMGADGGAIGVAMGKINSEFRSSYAEADVLEAFADLTGAILLQRDRFGAMIPPRDNSATHHLGAALLRALSEAAGLDPKAIYNLSYASPLIDFASPLGAGMDPY